MLTSESSKVSISVLPPRKFPRSKMLNLGVLRYTMMNYEQANVQCHYTTQPHYHAVNYDISLQQYSTDR